MDGQQDLNVTFLPSVITLAYLGLVELRLKLAGCHMLAATAMENMHRLHSCLMWSAGKGKPFRMIEEPTEIQAQILKAFDHSVLAAGDLRKNGSEPCPRIGTKNRG